MIIYNQVIQTGKTTRCIIDASVNKGCIIVANQTLKYSVEKSIEYLLKRKVIEHIPDVYTFDEIKSGALKGKRHKYVVVDEVGLFLEKVLNTNINYGTHTNI